MSKNTLKVPYFSLNYYLFFFKLLFNIKESLLSVKRTSINYFSDRAHESIKVLAKKLEICA